jgi:hypothetical protein
MELVFNQIDNKWVAEFEAAAHFNLHLERNSEGRLAIYSNGVLVDLPHQYKKKVIDIDFYVSFAKKIKIVSGPKPSMMIITFADGAQINADIPSGDNDVPTEYEEFEVVEGIFEVTDGKFYVLL